MVVGRDAELAAIDAFLAGAAGGLVLEGEAGIGKTTLWQAAVARASEGAMTVLASRPGAAETRLTFVGLADFLDAVGNEVFERLPLPQRRALDVALLRVEVDGAAPDQRAVSTAFLSVLRVLAQNAPVLVAVDDVQWLDAPSWRVVEFVRRRLAGEPVKFVTAVRLEGGVSPRGVEGSERIRLGPLNLAALHEVLREELGTRLPWPTLVRIEQASSGNPFFAVELARAVLDSGEPLHGSGPLPVPENLRELLERRLHRLPASSRAALLVASALTRPTVELVPEEGLAKAEQAAVVRLGADGRITFAHPLLAAAVYGSASSRERRRVHAELAARMSEPEERARHLALAAEAPDEAVAAALLDAGRRARDRGAPDTAVELIELACELTPPDDPDALRSRRLELGRHLAEVGDPQHARTVLAVLVDEAPPSPLRARALVLLAFQEEWAEGPEAATRLCAQALSDAADDLELSTEIHAAASRMCDHDVEQKMAHAQAALELAGRLPSNPGLKAYAQLAFAEAAFYAGEGIATAAFRRAAAFERAAEVEAARLLHRVHHYSDVRPSERLRGILAIYADELDLAAAEFEREMRIAADYGDDVQLARSLARLAIVEFRAGRWESADLRLREMAGVLERSGQASGRQWIRSIRAMLDAHASRVASAREAGEEALAMALASRGLVQEAESRAALGFLELSVGNFEAARAQLDRVYDIHTGMRIGEPGLLRFHGDRIEALLAVGAVDEAQRAADELERDAARPWALAVSARCRGLVSAALGDLDAAADALERAAEVDLPLPFERARTLLVKGRLHRRRKERLLAKESLEEAVDVFESLGADTWAEQARAELGRVGLRKGSGDELTPSEERIASLAALGLTNKAIAERIFVSPKTVESNLGRVYRKLGIRSRAELGAHMAERERLAQT